MMGVYDKNHPFLSLLRVLIIALYRISLWIICLVISTVCLNFLTKGRVTKFKIKRIRFFMRMKVWMYDNLPLLCKFLDTYDSFGYRKKQFGYGL